MILTVNDQISLTEFRETDKAAIVEFLNDPNIYQCTLRIPTPYTPEAADHWLALLAEKMERDGRPEDWVIRAADGSLMGAAGFEGVGIGHRAEIGYWLARPFWGRGIMPQVVRRLCRYAFDDLGLVKITAQVFVNNQASARVLEKCGFTEEGYLRKHFLKDGQLFDARLFGLIRE